MKSQVTNDELNVLKLIETRFDSLTRQLQNAARFAIDNPDEIAMNSMRSAASKASVHPNIMLRLARELGFASYEPFRDKFRELVLNRTAPDWIGRAKTIREGKSRSKKNEIIRAHVEQELENLQHTFGPETGDQIAATGRLFAKASSVYILGTRSMFSVAFYLNYVCKLFSAKTVLMTGFGGTFADELRTITANDLLVAFSHQPYSRDVVQAVRFARERKAKVVTVTDSKVSPINVPEGISIVVANKSQSLIPTLVPVLAVAQSLATFIVAEGKGDIIDVLEKTESQLRSFGVYHGDH